MTITIKTDSRPIKNQADIVYARQAVRDWAIELKLGILDQTKLITAASELARNTYVYGLGGDMLMEMLSDGLRKGIRLTFEDHGPGIANLSLALTDGWTSGGGLGMGLTGAKRLVSEFHIVSTPGVGTKVTITKWK
ncbi:MAG TPA: anti-sigma regulatory factor [Bacteriovoracaceae bacterium]|nr:anti-sigma regulatory factor [Bacteriovoracaceae bacterium]